MSDFYPRNHFVPLVTKNRDVLVGYLRAMSMFDLGDSMFDYVLIMSSARFNDILPGNVRRRNLTIEEQIQAIVDYRVAMFLHENEDEESEEDFETEEPFLKLHCECGNYHEFETEADIPKTPMVCEMCGRHLIDYTNKEDSEFIYDGDESKNLDFHEVMELIFGEQFDDDLDDGEDEIE